MHQSRDQRGQEIIVAQADLFDGDGVIFVHDRDHARREQRRDRRTRVLAAAALGQILMRQQKLRDGSSMSAERARPLTHQLDLSGGGRGLAHRDRCAVKFFKPRASGRDRARGHDDHLASGGDRGVDIGGQAIDHVGAKPVGVREHGAPDLDHDPLHAWQNLRLVI